MSSSLELHGNSILNALPQPARNSLNLVSHETQRASHRRAKLSQGLGLTDAQTESLEDETAVNAKAEAIAQIPASNFTWAQMTELARVAPELAEQKWSAIQQAASEERRSGHRAARLNQAVNASPIERARHLALSEEMRRNFEPRGGIEEVLLQNLVQAQAQYEHWLSIHVRLNSFGIQKPDDDTEPFMTPRLSEAEAIENAMTMIERWQRMFLRCLRALKDWRRQPVIVANQVNIAEQQIVSQSP